MLTCNGRVDTYDDGDSQALQRGSCPLLHARREPRRQNELWESVKVVAVKRIRSREITCLRYDYQKKVGRWDIFLFVQAEVLSECLCCFA